MKIKFTVLALVFLCFSNQAPLAADKKNDKLASQFNEATNAFAKYNGVSGESFDKDPISSEDYNQNNLELAAHIWADSEISQKFCKTLGPKAPPSYKNWWTAVNKYVTAEKTNSTKTAAKLESLKNKIEELKNSNPTDLQMESYRIHIEELGAVVDMISGSSLSSGGSSQISNSRIGSREELLASVLKASEASLIEDNNFKNAYQGCQSGIEKSNTIASQACSTSTVGCARTKEVCSEDACSTVPDPVIGSCELKAVSCLMVNTSIPLFRKVPVEDIKILYALEVVPSKELTERLLKILSIMDQQVNIFFSKSTDPAYDWITPLQICIKPIEKIVKDNGLLCPTDSKEGVDYNKATFAHLGRSDDLFSEINHFMVGSTDITYTPSFLDATANYKYLVGIIADDPKNKGLTTKEIENQALNKFWSDYIGPSIYTKNFAAGRDIQHGVDQKAAMEYAQTVMDKNNEKVWTCNDNNCKTPLPPSSLPKIVIPDYAKVTESAKVFLDALGIKDSLGLEMNGYLSDKWSNSDLIIGQSQNRLFYFKYIEEILTSLIASDRSKLTDLLLQRDKLINNLKDLTNTLATGVKVDSVDPKVVVGNTDKNLTGITDKNLTGTLYNGDDKQLNSSTSVTENSLTSLPKNTGISLNTSSNPGLEQASNGMISYVKSGNFSSANKDGRTVANNLNAIKYSKNVNDKIKKLSAQVSKLQKKNGLGSLNEQNKKYNNFSNRMKSKTNPKSLAQVGSMMFSGNSGTDSQSAGSVSTSGVGDNNKKNNETNGFGFGAQNSSSSSYGRNSSKNGSSDGYYGFVSGSGSGSGSHSSEMGPGSNLTAINDDQKVLDDAILARNKSKGQYDESDEDTIFKRISKSYIRNYEKLK